MSREYDEYLKEHIGAVQKGWTWMEENLIYRDDFYNWIIEQYQDEFDPIDIFGIRDLVEHHDESKTEPEEYFPYDDYFYLKKNNRSSFVVDRFNKAFLIHMHRNPHHWQYWVLTDDSKGDGEKVIEMPLSYIFEMICDWWSFSWRANDLTTIFKWWDDHKDWIRFHKRTRRTVDYILGEMKKILIEDEKEEPDKNEEVAEHADKEEKEDDKKFGVPEQKKFPLPDADHVKSAIRFFNYVDPKYEQELADAILERMKEYGMSFEDFGVGDENKFKKYIPKKELEEKE